MEAHRSWQLLLVLRLVQFLTVDLRTSLLQFVLLVIKGNLLTRVYKLRAHEDFSVHDPNTFQDMWSRQVVLTWRSCHWRCITEETIVASPASANTQLEVAGFFFFFSCWFFVFAWVAPRLCPGRQFRSRAALITPGQEARWTFWSQWPLRQGLDFPWRSCAPSNWPATQSGPWLTWTPNECVPGCCDIPTEDEEEVVHTCYSLFFLPTPTVSWPAKKETWNWSLVNPLRNQREYQRSL